MAACADHECQAWALVTRYAHPYPRFALYTHERFKGYPILVGSKERALQELRQWLQYVLS